MADAQDMPNISESFTITTETVIINHCIYYFEINIDSIKRHSLNRIECSPGCLVKDHFDSIVAALYCIHLLKDCGVKEAISSYYIGEVERKKYQEAPTLEKCLYELITQLSIMTDGIYDSYFDCCKRRHAGEDDDTLPNWRQFHDLPYLMEMQDIFWHILDLRNGKYNKSSNPKYEGRRGIPRIETTGERMYSELLDLIWKMDHKKH